MPNLFLLIFTLLAANYAEASGVCDGYRKNAPILYEMYCKQQGSDGGSTKPAGTTSTFSDSFKLNTAALPTEESPYGIEMISTFLTSGASPGVPNFAIMKGFHRFGTGLSTASANTFYSNPLPQRLWGPSKLTTLDDSEASRGHLFNLNLGTSFLIADPSWGPSVQVGLSARYNKITNTVGGGPAVMLASEYLTLGLGFSREKTSNYLDSSNFISFIASTRISIVELEYDRLSNDSQTNLKPVSIFTANLGLSSFIFTVAMRQLNYLTEGDVTQYHLAVQYLVSSHLSIGYLYNYIPGGNSLGLQIFL